MSQRFAGKAVLVTGGASGIGAACVAAFLAEGAKVASIDLRLPEAAADDGVTRLAGDVSEAAQAATMVEDAVTALGGLDILVNSAGIGALEPTETATVHSWRKTLAVNLDGTFYMAQAAIRHLLDAGRGGAIVNIASIHGQVGFPGHAAYTASKGAVVNLTRSLGVEFASRGIRVNAVCPGFVLTPMIEAGVTDELMPQIVALHPIGRIARAEEIAGPVLFLASDDASFMAGTCVSVDGGYTAQ
jgi:NAD(P)-dependent dehydrogenase (short-subunit alcohol dehydrogenase family)